MLAPFGQQFEAPVFDNIFEVGSAKFVGKDKDHLQLMLKCNSNTLRAIWFRARSKNKKIAEKATGGSTIQCVYQLAAQSFRGRQSLQVCIQEVVEVIEAN